MNMNMNHEGNENKKIQKLERIWNEACLSNLSIIIIRKANPFTIPMYRHLSGTNSVENAKSSYYRKQKQ